MLGRRASQRFTEERSLQLKRLLNVLVCGFLGFATAVEMMCGGTGKSIAGGPRLRLTAPKFLIALVAGLLGMFLGHRAQLRCQRLFSRRRNREHK